MGAALDSIKGAFSKGVGGLQELGAGIEHAAQGGGEILGGIAKGDLGRIKEGAKGINGGINDSIKGLGDVAGGAAGAAIGASPLGAALNHVTHGAASRLAEGTFTGVADTLVKGREGGIKMAQGLMHGNLKEAAAGAKDYGKMAMLFVPGAGEASLARTVGTNMLKSGLKGSATSEASYQLDGKQRDAETPPLAHQADAA
jgi:hypothetical protein